MKNLHGIIARYSRRGSQAKQSFAFSRKAVKHFRENCLRIYRKIILFDLFLSLAKGKTCPQHLKQRDHFLENIWLTWDFSRFFLKNICIRKDSCLPKNCFIENVLENKYLICQKFSQKCVKHRNKCAVQHGKISCVCENFNYFREDWKLRWWSRKRNKKHFSFNHALNPLWVIGKVNGKNETFCVVFSFLLYYIFHKSGLRRLDLGKVLHGEN